MWRDKALVGAERSVVMAVDVTVFARRWWCAATCCVWLVLAVCPAPAAMASEPAPAGGLLFALQPGMTVDSTEMRISLTSVKITYRLRNSGKSLRSALITFALPEIDRFSLGEEGGAKALRDPINIVGATSVVDGVTAGLRAQQRAYALGLDVTAALTQAKLPLLPSDQKIDAQIAGLPPAVVLDFIERGILQYEDGKPQPGWSLQTTGHWRQSFPPLSTILIEHTYTPIVGTLPLSEQALARAVDRGCLAPVVAEALRRRISERNPPQVSTVVVQASAVAGQDPSVKFRVQIDVPEGALVATTCLEPQIRPDARTILWSAQSTGLDQDVVAVIVR